MRKWATKEQYIPADLIDQSIIWVLSIKFWAIRSKRDSDRVIWLLRTKFEFGSAGILILRLKPKFRSEGMAKLVGKGVRVKSGRMHHRSLFRSFKPQH